jgi:hypothetical protein
LTSLRLDFYYHFADDLIQTNAHLCTTIRDHCQNLEYLTLSFPPSDRVDDTPRASVCHQLFRAPLISSTQDVGTPGMPNLKKAEIIGYHNYCEGSSRDMVIEASEDVWESQNDLWWKTSSDGEDSMDPECSHTNIQIHGTQAERKSLLNRREFCCVSGGLSQLSSCRPTKPQRSEQSSRGHDLILEPPPFWVERRFRMSNI